MSRKIFYQNDKLTAVTGDDHVMGEFFQLYDKDLRSETPEGEGLILDWSEKFSMETNKTGIAGENPLQIISEYITNHNYKS